MRLEFRENIILSKEEREAFELVERVLEGTMKECKTPGLAELCAKGLDSLYDFSDYVDIYLED